FLLVLCRPPRSSRFPYTTLFRSISILQSTGLVFLFHNGGGGLTGGQSNLDLVPGFSPAIVMLIVLTFTAGSALLMWMGELITTRDRKSTRLNSSHVKISYAVFCL